MHRTITNVARRVDQRLYETGGLESKEFFLVSLRMFTRFFFIKDNIGDCKYLNLSLGFNSSGVYRIQTKDKGGKKKSYLVYCQMETENGDAPWTVFQRRCNGSENFARKEDDYKKGFGNLNGEFWLGLDALHEFTKEDKKVHLLIEMTDWEGNNASARYANVKVDKGPKGITGTFLEGTAGDSLSYHFDVHFSAIDKDHDKEQNKHCAQEFQSGWWFNECSNLLSGIKWSNLNGKYLGDVEDEKGIIWFSFKRKLSLKFTEMKFQVP